MKPSARPAKTLSRLSDSVQRHLNMHALAAGAVGLAVLALASPLGKDRLSTNVALDFSFPRQPPIA
jgi:hypothetical protein